MTGCTATTKTGRPCGNEGLPELDGLCRIHYRSSGTSDAPANPHFTIFLVKLNARLSQLESNLARGRIAKLEDGLNKCDSVLSNLYDLVRFQALDISPHYDDLSDIHRRLLDAHDRIEKRRNSWWRRLLRPLAALIDVAAIILTGLPVFKRLLPPSDHL